MADILPFDRARARKRRARGKTLCKSGFHKWHADGTTRFDVKEGRLVTVERCLRCEATRHRLT